MRKFTFRWLLSLMVIMGFAFSSNAQYYLTEDFESGALPTGWTEEIGAATDSWTFNSDASSSYWTIPAHTIYAAVNEDACNCDMLDTRIISSVFDLSSATAPNLYFDAIPRDGTCTIQAFDGTTWTDVATLTNGSAWAPQIVDLSAYAGQSTVQIAFHYNDGGAWGYGFAVDDVVVREVSSETDFLTYAFPTQTGPATIDASAHTINIEVAASSDLTTLVADFTLSAGASSSIGGTAQVSGTTANDFTAPVTYDVLAEDGTTTQAWTVTVTQATISSETDITAFSFAEETGAASIDATAHTVNIEVNWQADLTTLVSTFSLSAGASTTIGGTAQVSGTTANDFSTPVTYDVLAEDGTTTQAWTVTVTQEATPLGAACDNPFTYTNINDAAVTGSIQINTEHWYTVVLDQNYVNVTFSTCGGSDGDSRLWVYDACGGNELGFNDDQCSYLSEVVIASLAAGIYYVKIDEYGQNAVLDYNLEITGTLPSTETDILTYSFTEQTGAATIDAVNHTVNIEVGMGTDVTALVSTFTLSTGANAEVATVAQVSGTTANDFTAPVTYVITAEDGTTTQAWTVTVTVATTQSSEKDILTFSFPEETGAATIDATAHTVGIEVNACADLTNLTPTITISGLASINPASGVAQDFSSAFVYTVTAEDATTQDWTVTVTQVAAPAEVDCATSFAYAINDADYTNTLCAATPFYFEVTLDQDYVNVRFETCGSDFDTKIAIFNDCADITDDMTTSPSNPANNIAYNDDDCANNASGVDFVTLSAGTYIAVVYGFSTTSNGYIEFRATGTPASDAEILTYAIPSQVSSEIFAANDSISVLMPQGTDVTALIADFTLSTNATVEVATVAQVSGTTANDWTTNPVDYIVTGEDGITTRTWSVWVTTNVGINNVIDSKDVTVYPNPNNGQFNIALNLNVNTVNMEVVNSLGQVVAQFENIDANSTQTINLEDAAEGMYYIRIASNNNVIIKKVNVLK